MARSLVPALLLAGMALVPSGSGAAEPDCLRVERHRVLDRSADDLVTGGLSVAGLTTGQVLGWVMARNISPGATFDLAAVTLSVAVTKRRIP